MSDSRKYLIIGASSGVGSALYKYVTCYQHQVITASPGSVADSTAHISVDI